MATKIVRDIDDETWRKFAGFCKMKGVRIGPELTEVLEKYLKDNK